MARIRQIIKYLAVPGGSLLSVLLNTFVESRAPVRYLVISLGIAGSVAASTFAQEKSRKLARQQLRNALVQGARAAWVCWWNAKLNQWQYEFTNAMLAL